MKAGFWEILLIVILILILFGHSKIPDLMKNLANGINIFKKELKTEDKKETEPTSVKDVEVPAKPTKATVKKTPVKKTAVKKPGAKKPVAKKTVAKKK